MSTSKPSKTKLFDFYAFTDMLAPAKEINFLKRIKNTHLFISKRKLAFLIRRMLLFLYKDFTYG